MLCGRGLIMLCSRGLDSRGLCGHGLHNLGLCGRGLYGRGLHSLIDPMDRICMTMSRALLYTVHM